jgi:general stress protein 26
MCLRRNTLVQPVDPRNFPPQPCPQRAICLLAPGWRLDGRETCDIRTACRIRSVAHARTELRVNETPGDLAALAALIREIRVGLMTTLDASGRLHTRPVQTLQMESEQTLWFFTDWSTPKVTEVERESRVSVGYADVSGNRFVAVSGSAQLFRDADKAKQLWSAEQLAYYPDGPGDARLALLRVQIERAEYWLAPGRAAYVVAAARAVLTGEPAGIVGENRKVDYDPD